MESRTAKNRPRLVIWFICVSALALATGTRADFDPAAQIALGNPSNATTNLANQGNYLISRPQYALAYSRYDGSPRWVSWHLNASDIGSSGRGSYQQDSTLPSGWYQVKVNETPRWSAETPYPYDRGHMCPSADRTIDDADNQQVFLMTNLLPQAPDNNQGPWEVLETYVRSLVTTGNECYVISGVHGFQKRISSGHVTVTPYLWKIIVVLPDQPGDDLARITTSTRVIAVEMPNVQGVRSVDWHTYRVSVDKIETETGLSFLSNVPVAIAKALKAKIDTLP